MTDGSRRRASTSRSMRGQAGAMTSWPRCSKRAFQPSQLRGVSQRPWMRTMGVGMVGLLVVQGVAQGVDGLGHRAARRVGLAERVEHHEVVRDAVVMVRSFRSWLAAYAATRIAVASRIGCTTASGWETAM